MFLYKTTLHLDDTLAMRLKIKLEYPFVALWQTKQGHIILTGPFTALKNSKLLGYYECNMTPTAWKIIAYLPFPWENNYYFEYFKYSVCILKNTKRPNKGVITNEPRVKTLSERRCRKTKAIQNLWNTESPKNGENPDIINTLI